MEKTNSGKFKEGNTFWKLRKSHGRNPIIKSPSDLWEGACKYFEWSSNNPIILKQTVRLNNGNIKVVDLPKKRPFSVSGLCLHINISRSYFYNLAKKPDFVDTVSRVRDIIYDENYSGAVVGIYHPMIIWRQLAFRNRIDISHSTNSNQSREFIINLN